MKKKHKSPNRQGFYNHLGAIRKIEKDKDEFCKAARIPRGGSDMFNNLDKVILDLNQQHSKGNIMISTYLNALDRIQSMIAEQNAHELRMAEIEAKINKGV